jgi:hypothetical protein
LDFFESGFFAMGRIWAGECGEGRAAFSIARITILRLSLGPNRWSARNGG